MPKSSILCYVANPVLIALLAAIVVPLVADAAEKLPRAVRSRIQQINLRMDKAMEVLDAERLNTARRKLRESRKILKEITNRYGSTFSTDDPTYRAMTDHMAKVAARIEAVKRSALEVNAKSERIWRTNDALCRTWIAKLGPFLDHKNALYLRTGAELKRASEEDRARSKAAYPKARALLEECQKITFPLGETTALQRIEFNLAAALRQYEHGGPRAKQGKDVWVGRGHRWVRSHPFTTMALTITRTKVNGRQYRQANFSTLLVWKAFDALLQQAVKAGMPWHLHVYPQHQGLTERLKANLKRMYDTYPGCTGWTVWDEVTRKYMFKAAMTTAWLRKMYPHTLVYSNGLPAAGDRRMYGGDPPPGGRDTYQQYQNDFIDIMNVDVLSYDSYPFQEGTGNIFPVMAETRKVGLERDVPYWTFVQSHAAKRHRLRMPSESDVRMQVFAHLTHGYTGILYFTYAGMVDKEYRPMPLYYAVARLNTEVANVGQALRFLTSTDVRIVVGAGSTLRKGTVAWSPGAGDEHRITDVTIDDPTPGDFRDVLLGFFRDDDGRRYVMVTNLAHGPGASAASRRMTVTLHLDRGIRVVGRLSRETGAPELLRTAAGKLTLTLPGGTGDLLRFGDAEFPGLKSK